MTPRTRSARGRGLCVQRRQRPLVHGARGRGDAGRNPGQGHRPGCLRQVPGWRHPALLRRHHPRDGSSRLPAGDDARGRAGGARGMAAGPGGRRPGRGRQPRTGGEGADRMTGEKVLITGGAGFVATNVADRLLRDGARVRVFDNLSRAGVEHNVRWLREQHGERVELRVGDVRDAAAVAGAVDGVDRIFHFAAQVAVTTSLTDPFLDFDVNARGTLNLLEAHRALAVRPTLIFTSTNKVYGHLDDVSLRQQGLRYEPEAESVARRGISESRPLDFHSPYGCSKGAAEQYVLDYARTFEVPAVVFRMSCIYGPHQFGTEDQGWVAHFLIQALKRKPLTL